LISAGVVAAGNPGKEKIALTAAGNKQAKAEVLHRADVGAGWKGGFKKPQLSSTMPCSNYRPKQSDLVLTGAAESLWQKPLFLIQNEAQVLRTKAMVHHDWQRTVLAPQVLPCLRHGFAKGLGSSGKLVSFGRIAFPRIAPETRAFRAVAKVQTSAGPVVLDLDFVALGVGRNELTLQFTAPKAAGSSLKRIETRWARLLARRARS
jgi:hypothetical protein